MNIKELVMKAKELSGIEVKEEVAEKKAPAKKTTTAKKIFKNLLKRCTN